MKVSFLIIAAATLISGCSSSPVTEKDKIDHRPYIDRYVSACIKVKHLDKSEGDRNTLCKNSAERAWDVNESLFWNYQEKNLLDKCGKEPGAEFTNCAKDYQERFMGKSFDNLIKKNYQK